MGAIMFRIKMKVQVCLCTWRKRKNLPLTWRTPKALRALLLQNAKIVMKTSKRQSQSSMETQNLEQKRCIGYDCVWSWRAAARGFFQRLKGFFSTFVHLAIDLLLLLICQWTLLYLQEQNQRSCILLVGQILISPNMVPITWILLRHSWWRSKPSASPGIRPAVICLADALPKKTTCYRKYWWAPAF